MSVYILSHFMLSGKNLRVHAAHFSCSR